MMTGPDGFDFRGTGCFLEVVPGERIIWTSALLPGYRPAEMPEQSGAFPFTAVVTLEDASEGRTRYKAVLMHKNAADRARHEAMGFHQGWGTCAAQLEQVATGLSSAV